MRSLIALLSLAALAACGVEPTGPKSAAQETALKAAADGCIVTDSTPMISQRTGQHLGYLIVTIASSQMSFCDSVWAVRPGGVQWTTGQHPHTPLPFGQ